MLIFAANLTIYLYKFMLSGSVVVIGGGAAGMLAAISAARNGANVTILEKMERLGRKVRITGKGRCNITNTKTWGEFSTHIYPKHNFFKPAFFNFSNSDTVAFFESIGVKTVTERGERVFPLSEKASDVVDALSSELERLGVITLLRTRVTGILTENGVVRELSAITETQTGKKQIILNPLAIIIATGGLSYPATGSDGDGYIFAEKSGHKINECTPSLTALMPAGYNWELEGLRLKNVELTLYIGRDPVQKEMGDLDFTNNGVEGSIGYKISRKAVKAIKSGNRCSLLLDLKPALSNEQLAARITRELNAANGISLKFLLKKLLPEQLISSFIAYSRLDNESISFGRREKTVEKLVKSMKCWAMEVESFTSYERAVITAGGVSLDDIYPKSMQSRVVPNMFFAGEVIDLDGDTGGYNLQIAFSTGYLAGRSAAGYLKSVSEQDSQI